MLRRSASLFVVIALVVGSMPAASLAATPFTPGAPGLGDPYFPLDGNGGYDVQRYVLDLTYDPATDELSGTVTIRARATQNLSAFNLDLVGLTVDSIAVDGRTATWSRDEGELTVTPARGIRKGQHFITAVGYHGVPEPVVDAFGVSGFLPTDDGAVAIGEPHVAATWFPANDHPTDKAAFEFRLTVPAGLEVIANGVLLGQSTSGGWSTWTWVADEPMTSYLAGMVVGEYDLTAYRAGGLRYWDAIDPDLFEDLVPPVTPVNGVQLLFSQVTPDEAPSYKRLTRTFDVAPGGAQLSFQVNRDTEPDWDFLFVEARTAGGDDWTTLPDLNGHTSQSVGACPFFLEDHPFLEHYLTPFLIDPGDPDDPFDDLVSCDPVGSSGEWHAASGSSDPGLNGGWEDWMVGLPNSGADPVQVEVSITYASDAFFQLRGVAIDAIVGPTGQGTTSFEDDGDDLDGWVIAEDVPEGSPPNPNTWTITDLIPGVPGLGFTAQASLARQPEIIGFLTDVFSHYPFSTAGGVVHDGSVIGFALENQTRPTYSPFFFFDQIGGDLVVVHELAHQWVGDSLAVEAWQHIWLNEGFATYAEWLWLEREGLGTAQESFDFWFSVFDASDPLWALPIGDPGPDFMFDFAVYVRGAMTLHALRLEVGDAAFFKILRKWTQTNAGGNVTTDEFIQLAEQISRQELDALFETWLFTPEKPTLATTFRMGASAPPSLREAPPAVRSLVDRVRQRAEVPFVD